jgi:integrase/recombinase XerD
VERPLSASGEGKTPALGDHQARDLLNAPLDDSLRHKRDRAILSTLLFHALRREELCKLTVSDFRHERRGVPHLRVSGKGGKIRYIPLHASTIGLVHEYLEAAGHVRDGDGALFRPIRNNATGLPDQAITPDGVYKLVRGYAKALGLETRPHALRATAATTSIPIMTPVPPGSHREPHPQRGPVWTPITPLRGSFFHAESHLRSPPLAARR